MNDSERIKIRNVWRKDIPFLVEIFEQSVSQTCVADYSPTQIDAWLAKGRDLSRWYQRLDEQFFVLAARHEKRIAFASLRVDGYLDVLFVHPEAQGAGVAGALLQVIKKEAFAQGHRQLLTDASITAKPFFEAHGFEVVRENNLIISEVPIRNYRMKCYIHRL